MNHILLHPAEKHRGILGKQFGYCIESISRIAIVNSKTETRVRSTVPPLNRFRDFYKTLFVAVRYDNDSLEKLQKNLSMMRFFFEAGGERGGEEGALEGSSDRGTSFPSHSPLYWGHIS